MAQESVSRHVYEVKLAVMFFNSFEWMIKTNALRNLHKSIMSYIVAMVALRKKYQNMLTKHINSNCNTHNRVLSLYCSLIFS